MNEIQEEYREYKKLCRVEDDPGVAGLAQLGRNAIERVSQLERVLAERDDTISQLRARLEIAQGREDFATSYSKAEYEHAMSMYRDAAHERNSLLAVIHRDGGHYQNAHGTAKAVEDAIRIVAERNAQLDEYERAPTFTYMYRFPHMGGFVWRHSSSDFNGARPIESIELIARPARKEST